MIININGVLCPIINHIYSCENFGSNKFFSEVLYKDQRWAVCIDSEFKIICFCKLFNKYTSLECWMNYPTNKCGYNIIQSFNKSIENYEFIDYE